MGTIQEQNSFPTLAEEYFHHHHHDPHNRGSSLSDIILGGQDGLVNVLGIILGVATATGNGGVVMVAGMAAAFAESISMAAVAYTSTLADADYYESERAREYRHIQSVPSLERREIQDIFEKKGFRGELLHKVVNTITADDDAWVSLMMLEEHGLTPVCRKQALKSAFVVGLSAIIGSLIPLVPFIFLPVSTSLIVSLIISAFVLFAVGAYKGRTTIGRPGRSGLEMAAIGIISALVGYIVGVLFKVTI